MTLDDDAMATSPGHGVWCKTNNGKYDAVGLLSASITKEVNKVDHAIYVKPMISWMIRNPHAWWV